MEVVLPSRQEFTFLGVEHLGLFYPFHDGSRDRGHGKNHGGELLV